MIAVLGRARYVSKVHQASDFLKLTLRGGPPLNTHVLSQGIRDSIDLLIEHNADLIQLRPLKRSEK
jgi:hypothetical protein